MRWGIAGLMLALMTASAQAQVGGTSGVNPGTAASMNIGQHAQAAVDRGSGGPRVKANDSAYSAALKNLPDKQFDPWHGVR